MSLCRYLPTPSDRMAVMWTLLNVEQAVVLEYGPAGTTHYSMGLFGTMGISSDCGLYTTHMSEDDVIMGDVTRLEDAIVEIDQTYAPRVIFVVASAISAVIGTDLAGVCAYMQHRVNAQLLPLESGGFRGDYTVGLRDAYTTLIRGLVNNKEEKQHVFNILGASAGSYRIHSDLWEIQDLLERAFGLKMHCAPGLRGTVEEIEKMGAAAVNLVLRFEALPAARLLQERFGTPYVYGAPYGCSGTELWLDEISKVLGIPVASDVLLDVKKRRKEIMSFRMYTSMSRAMLNPPAAALVGNYDTLVGLTGFFKELAIPVDLRICLHSLKDVTGPTDGIAHFVKERDQIDAIRALRHHLVLADDVSLHLCDESNVGRCISFPIVSRPQIAKHMPLMGLRGTDDLLETVQYYYGHLDV